MEPQAHGTALLWGAASTNTHLPTVPAPASSAGQMGIALRVLGNMPSGVSSLVLAELAETVIARVGWRRGRVVRRTWEQVKVPRGDVFPPSAPPLALFAAYLCRHT